MKNYVTLQRIWVHMAEIKLFISSVQREFANERRQLCDYRAEKVSDPTQKVSDLDEKVTEQTEKVSEQAEKSNRVSAKSNRADTKSNGVRLTAKQRKVLEFCDVTPRTAREIVAMIGVSYQTKTLEQYVTKLVFAGVLRPTTVSRNDSNRKYITAHSD